MKTHYHANTTHNSNILQCVMTGLRYQEIIDHIDIATTSLRGILQEEVENRHLVAKRINDVVNHMCITSMRLEMVNSGLTIHLDRMYVYFVSWTHEACYLVADF